MKKVTAASGDYLVYISLFVVRPINQTSFAQGFLRCVRAEAISQKHLTSSKMSRVQSAVPRVPGDGPNSFEKH